MIQGGDAPVNEAGSPTLHQHALAGVKWMGLTRLVAESTAFLSSIALARLIGPEEFGRTVVAMFLGTVTIAVSQLGVGSYLVHLKDPQRSDFEAASFASLAAGVAGTALILLFALTLAPLIFGAKIATYTALASPMSFFAGIAAVPIAQLNRQLRFGRLGLIEASASVAMPASAIVLAACGLQGRAIVFGGIIAGAVTAVLACCLSPPVGPRWRPRELRANVRYGAPATGSSILYTTVRNIDYVVLAALVPAFQVGLYMRAFALGTDYQGKISQILVGVAFPILSRAQEFNQVRRARMRMVRVHATVLFPLLLGLIAVAPQFVPWMYGAQWAPAADLTQILAVGGLIAVVATGTGPVLMATGHTRGLLVYNLFDFVTYAIAVVAAVPFGITAVCFAVVGTRIMTFMLMQYVVVERRVGIPLRDTLRDAGPALVAGVPQLVATFVLLRLALAVQLPVALSIAFAGAAGLALYAALLRRLFPAVWADLRIVMLWLPVLPAAGTRAARLFGFRGSRKAERAVLAHGPENRAL